MKPIKYLVPLEVLEELASRSNFRLGKAIASEGQITFEKQNTFNVIAKVRSKKGETRTVHLESTSKGLRWKCTCSSRKDLFCQHCVAVGMYIGTI